MLSYFFFFFFFNDTATTEIYTLSLHDALPILLQLVNPAQPGLDFASPPLVQLLNAPFHLVELRFDLVVLLPNAPLRRSEEHTSELQSQSNLVCRLLLEKKNKVDIAKDMASCSI